MFPDFLGIGAQKAGTRWLYDNLKHHPAIWLPPVKELHYFNNNRATSLWVRLFGAENAKRRRYLKRHLRYVVMPEKRPLLWWYLRYGLLAPKPEWYASLFKPTAEQIAGEITPAYALLQEERIAEIKRLMPELKIIYILRNPILRAWSQAAMIFEKRNQSLYTASNEEIKRYLTTSNRLLRHGQFMHNLDRWGQFFSDSQIHVTFFDQISQTPALFLKQIYRFLNIDASDKYIPGNINNKRHARQYPDIPPHFAAYLANYYHDQLQQLHQRFDNEYTAKWINYSEQLLQTESVTQTGRL